MSSISQSQILHEETLVEQAINGDLEAFNQLVLAYQNLAYHHAFALLGDRDLAEDATQDSFIRAFQAMHGFRGGSLRGWLLKIVTNSAYDLLRRSYRHPSQPLFPEDETGEDIESPCWLEGSASVRTEDCGTERAFQRPLQSDRFPARCLSHCYYSYRSI